MLAFLSLFDHRTRHIAILYYMMRTEKLLGRIRSRGILGTVNLDAACEDILRHPAVVYECITQEEVTAMFYAYVEGGTLARALRALHPDITVAYVDSTTSLTGPYACSDAVQAIVVDFLQRVFERMDRTMMRRVRLCVREEEVAA